jgi:Double zinc ribbon
MAKCAACAEELPAGAEQCPACFEAVEGVDSAIELDNDGDAYTLPAGSETGDIPMEWQGGAVYMLELPARCPYCKEQIRTIRVLKLKRTQVTFVSTLPRGGRAIVCPECDRILSVELTTL